MSHPRGLSSPSSFVTTLSSDGSSVFTEPSPSLARFKTRQGSQAVYADMHISPCVPISLTPGSANYDLTATTKFEAESDSFTAVPPQGVVFRRIDLPPNSSRSPMHRTLTVDYGVLVAGEVELTLDSGETRILKVGDTIIQRATMHKWRNMSDTEWVRMVWVMLPIEDLFVNDQPVKEQWILPNVAN